MAKYIRILAKEIIDQELDALLEEKISRAVQQHMKTLTEQTHAVKKDIRPKPSREELARMLGMERLDSETFVASTNRMITELPPSVNPNNEQVQKTMAIINRDYSAIMQKIK